MKNETSRFGDTICTRLPAEIKITTYSVGLYKPDRLGPGVEEGCNCGGLCSHMFKLLQRALRVAVSAAPRDGSSKVIVVRFKAFTLYMP